MICNPHIQPTVAMVATYPTGVVPDDTQEFLFARGVKEIVGVNYGDGDIVCGLNMLAQAYLVMPEKYPFVMFMEHDVHPIPDQMDPFFQADADVVCVKYPTLGHEAAWLFPDSFHTGFYWTRREVIQSLRPPWFTWQYDARGTSHVGCLCTVFKSRLEAKGFTFRHAGQARHQTKPETANRVLRIRSA